MVGCDYALANAPGLRVAANGDESIANGVRLLAGAPQLFPLDTVTSYNNAAFMIAARIVEVVRGEPYARALRLRVLKPAGMRPLDLLSDEVVTHRVAAPHFVAPDATIVLWRSGWQPGLELSGWDQPVGGVF